ncbi:hypothetical protein [Olivibacter jilunii]|uniref:hypothetical protein n=1 Tax=Olivibacter jilunii TaxID=985016 RepID=UPI00103212D2|nr:hypothetical protein [Olivibacter jilunii]
MKKYLLKSKGEHPDVEFDLDDLIGIPCPLYMEIDQLTLLPNYRDFHPCEQPMEEDYGVLYAKPENKGCDFFRIKGTELVVIPGDDIHCTLLTESDIRSGKDLIEKAKG